MKQAKIAFVVLDAVPFGVVETGAMPTVSRLALEGGYAKNGGTAVLSASTYPNHASLITGCPPSEHRIFSKRAWCEDQFVEAKQVGPVSRTLFDDCQTAGLRAVAVTGDQNLIGVCGAQHADAHWPPDGVLPENTPRGRLGYAADRAVVEAFDALGPDKADFIFVQLDEVDTSRHLDGPWNSAVRAQCEKTDTALADLLERLRPSWSETVVIVVSDHDHEAVRPGAIDLEAYVASRDLNVLVDHDGTSAVVAGEIDPHILLQCPGVIGSQQLAKDITLVWGEPGLAFGCEAGLAAQHGSPRTAKQLAVVGGGHPAAALLGQGIQASPPSCMDWATWIRELLGNAQR